MESFNLNSSEDSKPNQEIMISPSRAGDGGPESIKEYFGTRFKEIIEEETKKIDLMEGIPENLRDMLRVSGRERNLLIVKNSLRALADDPRMSSGRSTRIRFFHGMLEDSNDWDDLHVKAFARSLVDALKEILPDDMARYFESLMPR